MVPNHDAKGTHHDFNRGKSSVGPQSGEIIVDEKRGGCVFSVVPFNAQTHQIRHRVAISDNNTHHSILVWINHPHELHDGIIRSMLNCAQKTPQKTRSPSTMPERRGIALKRDGVL